LHRSCTQTEKEDHDEAYDAVMGKTTDSLIGSQSRSRLKNLEKPQPGTISIREGYTVTDKADGDRAQVFVTDGKAYLIDNRLNVTIIGTGCDEAGRDRSGRRIDLHDAERSTY
jgi:hypothetical protein